ncbi:cenpe protein [Salpingoeca rosetta]|uniref:Cenpe protein n=1 Tax=Salpingoeca rosetta (strain ATCC 50818 / BSB-021) TaxID=946362 RepID=F2UC41_SALR5|nr:cenpe protein [Salpingoeca rosetta]EGD74148.1 cenpe protein [Salpingoeca rosetta]|eukprot:XP_004993049.1 cenpe protein [Salpingoeca rosetta]
MESVSVSIRVRPLNDREAQSNAHVSWDVDQNSITQCNRPPQAPRYVFDNVFNMDSRTKMVYEKSARPIVDATMAGMHGTIFAYGQTSSGKTHTMMGEPTEEGIIPLSIQDIFNSIEKTPDREFLLRVSFMEIYNEVIADLLAPENNNLKVHETSEGDIYVGGLTEEVVCSPEEILRHMQIGQKNRKTGSTRMNDRSSRSHTIFRIVVESRECTPASSESSGEQDRQSMDGNGAVRVAHLNLVDLAGSERVSLTGAEGQRLKEGAHINKSLLTLGTVIAKLSDGVTSETGHIPYRDSKLTRILQNSLGGNARTAIICTITPASLHVDESISTLKFASRAKTIKNNVVVNEVYDDAAMLRKMKREINQLKKRNQLLEDGSELQALKSEKQSLEEALKQRDVASQRQAAQLDRLKRVILTSNTVHALVGPPPAAAKQIKTRRNRRKTWCPGLSEDSVAKRSLGLLFSPSKAATSSSSSSTRPRQRSMFLEASNEEQASALSQFKGARNHAADSNNDSADGTNTTTTTTTSGTDTAQPATEYPGDTSTASGSGAGARRKRSLFGNGVPRLKTAKDTMATFKRKARARRSLASSAANLELMNGLLSAGVHGGSCGSSSIGGNVGVGGMQSIPEDAPVADDHDSARPVATRADIFKAKAQRLQTDLIEKQRELESMREALDTAEAKLAEAQAAHQQQAATGVSTQHDDEEVARWQAELKSLHDTLASQHAHVEALEGRIVEQQQHFETELKEARENTGFLQEELDILRETCDQEQAATAALKQEVTALQARIDEQATQLAAQQEKLSAADTEHETLAKTVAEKDARIAELEAEVVQTRTAAKEEATRELQAEMDAARNEAQQALRERQEKEDALCELEVKLASQTRKLNEMMSELTTQRGGDDSDTDGDAAAEKARMKTEEEEEEEKRRGMEREMQQQLETMTAAIRKLHNMLNATPSPSATTTTHGDGDASQATSAAQLSTQDMVAAVVEAVEAMQKELAASKEQSQTLLSDIAQQKQDAAAAAARSAEEHESLEAYVQQLQTQLVDAQQEHAEVDAKLQQQQQELEALQVEQQKQRAQQQEEEDAEETAAADTPAAVNVEAVREEMKDEVRAELEAFYIAQQQELSADHDRRVQQLMEAHQQQLREETAKLDAMQTEVEALVMASESQTQSQEDKATLSVEEHERVLTEAKAEWEKQAATLQQELSSAHAEHDAHMQQLRSDLDAAKEKLVVAAEEKETAHAKVAALQAELDSATAAHDEAVQALQEEVADMRAELMEMEAERDALSYEYTVMKARTRQLQQSLCALQHQLKEATAAQATRMEQDAVACSGDSAGDDCSNARTDADATCTSSSNISSNSDGDVKQAGNTAITAETTNNNNNSSSSSSHDDDGDNDNADDDDESPKRKGDSRRFGRRKRKKKLGGRGELTSPTTLAQPKSGFRSLVSKLMTPIRRKNKQHRKKGKGGDDDNEGSACAAGSSSAAATPVRETTNKPRMAALLSPSTPAPSTPLTMNNNSSSKGHSESVTSTPNTTTTTVSMDHANASPALASPKDRNHTHALSTRFEELTAAHTALQDAQANLNAQLQAATEQVTVSQERIAELEAEAARVSEALKGAEEQRDAAQSALHQAEDVHKSAVSALESQLAELRSEHAQATTAKAELAARVEQLQTAGDEATTLLAEAKATSERLTTLEEENTEMASYVEELETVNERLLSQLETMQQEVEEAHAQREQALASMMNTADGDGDADGAGHETSGNDNDAVAGETKAEDEANAEEAENEHKQGDATAATASSTPVKMEEDTDAATAESGEETSETAVTDLASLQELEKECTVLKQRVTDLEQSLEQQETSFADERAHLVEAREAATAKCTQLATALATVRQDVQALCAVREQLKQDVAAAARQHEEGVEKCQVALTQQSQAAQHAREEVSRLEAELTTMASKLAEAEAVAHALQSEAAATTTATEQEVVSARQELQRVQEECTELRKAMATKDNEAVSQLEKLQQEHAAAAASVSQLQASVESLSSELTTMSLEKEDALQRCKALEEQCARVRARAAASEQEAQAALARAQEDKSTRVQQLEAERTALSKEAKHLRTQVQDQVRLLDTARDARLEMEVELEHARAQSQELQAQVDKLCAAVRDMETKANEQQQAHAGDVEALQRKLASAVAAKESAEQRVAELESSKTKAEESCATLRKDWQRASRKLKKLTAAANCDDYWQRQAEELKAHVERLQQEADSASGLGAKVETLQQELAAMTKASEGVGSELEQTKAALGEKQRELQKLRLKVDTMQAYNDQLQDKLKEQGSVAGESDAPGQVGQSANYELKEKNKRLVRQLEQKQTECKRLAQQLTKLGHAAEVSALPSLPTSASASMSMPMGLGVSNNANPLSVSVASTIKGTAADGGSEFAGMMTSTPEPKGLRARSTRRGAIAKMASVKEESCGDEDAAGVDNEREDAGREDQDRAQPLSKRSKVGRSACGGLQERNQRVGGNDGVGNDAVGDAVAASKKAATREKQKKGSGTMREDPDAENQENGNSSGNSKGAVKLSLNESVISPSRALYERAKAQRRKPGQQEAAVADQCNQQ